MPKKPEDFRASIARKVQDQAGKLADVDYDAFRAQAISQRYSQDRPLNVVTDVAADGTADLPLPVVAPVTNVFTPVYEEGFSIVETLEYPIGRIPETYILDSDWRYYKSPAGQKLRILSAVPSVGEFVRVAWTARHSDDGSTVTLPDFEAVCDFAASLCCEALAAMYAQTRDNTVSADVVNYRTKSQEYLALGKALRQRYFNSMGVDEGTPGKGGGADQGPAIAIGDMDNIMQGGVDRLIHSKYTR